MFGKLRELGGKIQTKYENIISSQSLFGFSNAYAEAMREIKSRKHKEAA
jgi:hypothetical protein